MVKSRWGLIVCMIGEVDGLYLHCKVYLITLMLMDKMRRRKNMVVDS